MVKAVETTDVPATDLVFVDHNELVPTWRVCLWAEPGQGKSVAGCSAPDPILVVSADRPTAYLYVVKHWRRHWWDPATGERLAEGDENAVEVPAKKIKETRFTDWQTMENAYRYVRDRAGTPDRVRTVIVDPISNIYDYLTDIAPLVKYDDGREQPDYKWVNQKLLGWIKSMRPLDVNVVLIGHVKEPKRNATMIYPNLGGPALTERVMRELDIIAFVELQQLPPEDSDNEDEEPRFRVIGQVQTANTNRVCKDGTGALGVRRVLDLSRWFELAAAHFAPDDDDIPWLPGADPAPGSGAASDGEGQAAVPPPPAPASLPMPDLTNIKTRGGAIKKLRAAGCTCAAPLDPVGSENPACPLKDHGYPEEEQA